jgi:hypothetical protein
MDWRLRTSDFVPKFVAFEDAMAYGNGHDAAAKLKSYLPIPFIEMGDWGHMALLLVGDAEVLPVRYVFTDILQDGNLSDPLNYRWTDDYYAYGYEFEWDRDGDGIYGEDGEVLSDLPGTFNSVNRFDWSVGRIPASSNLELERYVQKLLDYEQDPPPGDWYTSGLIVSGLMDVPNHLDNPYTPDLDGGYELFSDNSWESHTKLQDILPDRYDNTWLYDYPHLEGGHWNMSVDTLDHTSMVTTFDQGHSIMAMNGHGWIDGTGLAHYNGSGYSNYWWDWSNAFDYADADAARNGGRLPWAYVAACYVGDITLADDKTLERLVMNPDGGAIGLVAGNGENYKGESMANASYGNWFLERNFWANYFKVGPGLAMHNTKADYLSLVSGDGVPHTSLYDAYYVADYLSHNLLGDPLTAVWTDLPGRLQVGALNDAPDDEKGYLEIRVLDGTGNPVPDAMVFVGWEADASRGRADGEGWVKLEVPVDSGDIEVVLSSKNHLPLQSVMGRPVVGPDLEVSDLTWLVEDIEDGGSPPLGAEITLSADIDIHGRYDFDVARVRFSIAPQGGAFEDLVPDHFMTVETGTETRMFRVWTPTDPGPWDVRVEVDPGGDLPDSNAANNVMMRTVTVLGPPEWTSLPEVVDIVCSDAPGGSYDLLDHIDDPDTPIDELSLSVKVVQGASEDTQVHIDAQGRLWVCPGTRSEAIELVLTAEDGMYEAETTLTVNVSTPATKLRLVAPAAYTLGRGEEVDGRLTIEAPEGESLEGLRIVELVDYVGLEVDLTGTFTFIGHLVGIYAVPVGIQRADGTTEPGWEGAWLVFDVTPVNSYPPQMVGIIGFTVVEGERADVHLTAVDFEGSPVTYTLITDDGLHAALDPDTGMLRLDPADGDTGRHEVTVELSDGDLTEEVTLIVVVTGAPETGGSWTILVLALIAMVAIGVLGWLYWPRPQQDDE